MAASSWWRLIAQKTEQALSAGTLYPFETTPHFLKTHSQSEVQFVAFVASALKRKPEGPRPGHVLEEDPFLNPHTKELFVAHLNARYSLMLNKFYVTQHHTLVVTREFEAQERPLERDDFAALLLLLLERDCLVFYNRGAMSGASQPHMHFQVMPLPLLDALPTLPLERMMPRDVPPSQLTAVPEFNFCHACCWLSDLQSETGDGSQQGAYLHDTFVRMSTHLALSHADSINLLLTRRLMFVVKRSHDSHAGLSVNSVGFTGSFLVKSTDQFDTLCRVGPLALLHAVSAPKQA